MPKERGLERNSLHFAVLSSLFVNLRFNSIVGPRPVNEYGTPPGQVPALLPDDAIPLKPTNR